jgi:hypothetical protein
LSEKEVAAIMKAGTNQRPRDLSHVVVKEYDPVNYLHVPRLYGQVRFAAFLVDMF